LIDQKGFWRAICEAIVGREHQDKIKNIKKRKELGSRKTLKAGLARRELSFFKEGDVVISRDDNSLLLLHERLNQLATPSGCWQPPIDLVSGISLSKSGGVV
jgi:hypothetical protein